MSWKLHKRKNRKPILLATLGLDNVDSEGPWIPDPAELDDLRDELKRTLTDNYDIVVYHHGLNIQVMD
jgi:hypothetical protein